MDIPAILCVVTRADELLRLIVDQADEMARAIALAITDPCGDGAHS